MRAIRARYNPFLQTRHRVEQLKQLGHSVDKIEFIVMGGTFMSLPEEYRDYFIRNLHDALSGHTSKNVAEAVMYSERSHTKCIGITIETRPDYCMKRHLTDMLNYGCTRLEIGVQSVYEDVARDTVNFAVFRLKNSPISSYFHFRIAATPSKRFRSLSTYRKMPALRW